MEAYQRLEEEWARFNDLDPAGMVCCNSGTSALHLALESLQLPPQSEVLTGDFNMVAVARAISMAGLKPVFVDCDERLLMDPLLVPYADEKATAVIVTHIYGRQLNFDECRQRGAGPRWCWRDGLKIIEDLAEAHGVRPQTAKLDTDAACWSFYKNKIIAGEEGGAVWFRDPKHAEVARELRSLGFTAAHNFMHRPRGHNYRLANALAEPILRSIKSYNSERGVEFADGSQLVWNESIDPTDLKYMYAPTVRKWSAVGNNEHRREIESWYNAACPPEWRMPKRDAVWVYDVKLLETSEMDVRNPRFGLPDHGQQDRVVAALRAAGIEARHAFKPMHVQEEFKGCRRVYQATIAPSSSRLSVADRMSASVIYLPVQPGVTTEADCRRAFQVIRDTLDA